MAAKTSQKRVLFTHCPKWLGASLLVAICFTVLGFALLLFTPALRTYAATSPTINFQARLMNTNGSVVADGSYSVAFKIYSVSSGGSALWTETQTLSVTNGYLTANLGSVTTFNSSIPWGSPIWLTMNVNGDGEMSPRLSITSVPSALALTSGNGGTNVSTLTFAAPTASEQIILPAESGATETVCYQGDTACGFASTSGSGSYIDNQTSLQAGANFNISGKGVAATALQAPSFDTASAGALAIGGTNATSVTIGNTSASSTLTLQGGTGASAINLTPATNGSIVLNATGTGTITLESATAASAGVVVQSTYSGDNLNAFEVENHNGGYVLNVNTFGSVVNIDWLALGIYGSGGGYLDTSFGSGPIAIGNVNASGVTIGNSTAGTAIAIQGGTGASAIGLTAAAGGSINVTTSGAGKVNVTSATGIVNKITGSQVTGFQIQNSGSVALFDVDTTNSRVGIDNNAPGYALDVTGDINTSTVLRVAGTDVCDTTGSTGCIAKSGSGYYIHNAQGSVTLQTAANFYLQGGSGVVTGVLEANGADVLDLQNSSTTPVVTFSSTGATVIKPSTSSTTAFQIQNAASTADVIDADTTNDYFGVDTNSPSANFQVNQSTLAPGTVSNSATSTAVTGTSTTFTTTFNVGDTFTVTSTTNTCTIASITDDTHLTCGSALASASTNSAYTTGNTPRLVVQNNGSVGIGTATPTNTLDVATNNAATTTPQVLIAQSGSGDASLQFQTPAKSWTIGANAANSSDFTINSSTAANIATLGNNGGASTDSGDQNSMECSQYTATLNGTATSISVRVNTAPPASPNDNFSMAVYTGTSTQPTTLLASATAGTISSTGINTLPISFSMTNGTIYWLCANNNANSSAKSNWGYDTGVTHSSWFAGQTFGTWPGTVSGGTASNQKFAYYVTYTPSGSFTSFSSPLFTMTDTGQTTLQNSSDSTSEFNIQNASGVSLFSVGSSNTTLTLGAGAGVAVASTINIATSASATQLINIGSATANSASASTAVLIQGGSTSSAVSIQALASGMISIGTANAANAIQIGSTSLSSGTQTIGIGNNTTSGGTTNITVGASSSAGGFTTIQAAGALSLTGGAASTWQLTSGTLTLKSAGNVAIQGAAVTAAGTATSSFTTSGGNLSFTDSASSSTVTIDESGTSGVLNLGNATSTININGTGASNNSRTVNISTGATSQAQTVTIGNSANTGASAITINAGTNSGASVSINGGTQTATTTIGNTAGGNVAIQTSTNLTVTSTASAIPMFINEASSGSKESAIGYELSGGLQGEIGVTGTANHIVNQSAVNDLAIKAISGNIWLAAGSSQASVEISAADGSESVQSTSAAALNIQTSGSVAVFQVNTSNQDIIIGGGTGDPTGVPGAMYFNSSTDQFRCYNNGKWENCLGIDSDAFRQNPFYAVDFLDNGPDVSNQYLQTAAPWTGYTVGGGTTQGSVVAGTISTQTSDHPGVVRIESGSSTNTGVRYALNGTGMSFNGGESYELVFNLDNVSNEAVCFGFFNSSSCTTATPTAGTWISISGATLRGNSTDGTLTQTSTHTVSASTWYRAKIVMTSASSASFYLYDDSGTQLWTQSLSTHIPTGQFGPAVAATSSATSTNIIDLDYMALWWAQPLTR